MSRTENSGEPGTLPAPELNPLLNPLLADNMGRWAHVYFTSPPEKREHAVYELLRELENEKAKRAETDAGAHTPVRAQSVAQEPVRQAIPVRPLAPMKLESQPATIRCNTCGRNSPGSQKFCGMCGTRLGEEIAGPIESVRREDESIDRLESERHQSERHISDLHIEDQHIEDQQVVSEEHFAAFQPYAEAQPIAEEREVYHSRSSPNDLSLFQSIGLSGEGYDYGDEAQDGVAHRSYRVYVGIAAVVIIGVLAYMAWRGVEVSSRTSPAAPTASSEIPKESLPPTPVPTDSARSETPSETRPAADTKAPSHEPAAPAHDQATTRTAKPLPSARPKPVKPAATPPQPEATSGTGNEELALAERYLSGANGQGRNSSEAVPWLWKAMAKHNAEAPLLLSDLYLKGDGVAKNCDQARILLDAAALRGIKDAGQRLRHLQAFGCQ